LIGLIILKSLYKLSDEGVVSQWMENPYFQAFTGQTHYTNNLPRDPSVLSEFRKRLGYDGCSLLFAESVRVNGKAALKNEVIIDTTVQEKRY
jgi:IS5 family transposase